MLHRLIFKVTKFQLPPLKRLGTMSNFVEITLTRISTHLFRWPPLKFASAKIVKTYRTPNIGNQSVKLLHLVVIYPKKGLLIIEGF